MQVKRLVRLRMNFVEFPWLLMMYKRILLDFVPKDTASMMTRSPPLKTYQTTILETIVLLLLIKNGDPKPRAIGEAKAIGLKMLVSVNIHQTIGECHGFSISFPSNTFVTFYLWRRIRIWKGNRWNGQSSWDSSDSYYWCLLLSRDTIVGHGSTYQLRGAVDEHNAKRHDGGTGCGISLEASWGTTIWENRVFSFILAISEVNAFLGRRYFHDVEAELQIDFRRKLSMELIMYMDELDDDRNNVQGPITRRMACHDLKTAPVFSKFLEGRWVRCTKRPHQQFTCSEQNCTRRIRTYCTCSPQLWRCTQCYAIHYSRVVRDI